MQSIYFDFLNKTKNEHRYAIIPIELDVCFSLRYIFIFLIKSSFLTNYELS